MLPPTALEWCEPLNYLPALTEKKLDYALLYSGLKTTYSGRYSLLALYPQTTIESEDFDSLEQELTQNLPRYANFWLGYLGYGLKNSVENLTRDAPSYIPMPSLCMRRYATILVFDHEAATLTMHRMDADAPLAPAPAKSPFHQQPPAIATLHSDMHKAQYLQYVEAIQQAIVEGSLYQANLTRKFFGEFSTKPCAAALFTRLAELSPAPYSALLVQGDTAIVSSSPERFLQLTEEGHVEVRPIKGSAPRSADAATDRRLCSQLAKSEKDRAENLMIVDLMRNDIARGCKIGSVKTEALFEISSYATVHHMSSTISGQRRGDVTPLQLVAKCFPPGSMTGAPKIQAMELCSSIEPRARGVYSGAIGWFGGDGAADLSVVIRTIILQGTQFEFQVGGAIEHESTPLGEWEETLTKARGIASAMCISLDRLRNM